MEKMQLLIKEITSDLSSKKKDKFKELFKEYIKIFYSGCHSKDFVTYSPDELLSLASSSFDFFREKPKNKFKIRLYNPTKGKDGLENGYTVLDVINDDMPFLVDSMIIQFDRLNIEIKNVIHPIIS